MLSSRISASSDPATTAALLAALKPQLVVAKVEAVKRGGTPQLARLKPHAAQRQIRAEARRFNVASCGRRIGKTMLAVELIKETVLASQPVAYFAPTYKMLIETWGQLVEELKPITASKSEQEKRIETKGGGLVECWSLDTELVARSRKYKRAVIDEAAHVSGLKHAWDAAIRPTLTDLRGDGWFFSTPAGMNDFWQFYQRGADELQPSWASWQMPTSANPYIAPEEIEEAKRELPADIFAQEYLAEFIADSGAVFRHITEAATAQPQAVAREFHEYVIGCDWAKYQDFSVFTVIDTRTRELVHLARYNRLEYQYQIERLLSLCELFCPAVVSSEETGNIALAEQLRRLEYFDRKKDRRVSMPLRNYKATNASKAELVQALALAFERHDIRILNDPVLIGELQAFRFERTDAGNLRYSAPEGFHDDCVTSLMQAWNEARRYAMAEKLTPAEEVRRRLVKAGYVDENRPADNPIAWDQSRRYYERQWMREANKPSVYGPGIEFYEEERIRKECAL